MRVTENTNYNAVRDAINRSKDRLENFQFQSSTLKKLNTPSDDPVGASKVLEVRTEKVNTDQFTTNAKMAETFLNISDHALEDLSEIVVRAKEIALNQASGASASNETRISVSEEVNQLYQQAVVTANRKIGERYIFGGYRIDRAPVTPEGHYTGDDGEMMVEIGKDVFIPVNLPGIDAFNTQPAASRDARQLYGNPENPEEPQEVVQSRVPAALQTPQSEIGNTPENVNVFDVLQNLRISLLTGDLDGTRNTLDRLDHIHNKLVSARARVGARVMGIRSAGQAMEKHSITNANLTSTIEDADMAKVMSDLAREETIFRSALQSGQKLIQPKLMDFLK